MGLNYTRISGFGRRNDRLDKQGHYTEFISESSDGKYHLYLFMKYSTQNKITHIILIMIPLYTSHLHPLREHFIHLKIDQLCTSCGYKKGKLLMIHSGLSKVSLTLVLRNLYGLSEA